MKILSFSGFIPEQICDTVRFTGYPGDQKISHYCGYAADFISQVLDDPEINGAVFPRTCDSSRTMKSYMEGCGKFIYPFHVPARQDDLAVSMLSQTIRDYQNAVERYYGVTISEADIKERIRLVNERNQALSALYDRLDELSYYSYLEQIHSLLQKPLREQNVIEPDRAAGIGKRVYLTGSFLCDARLVRTIEDSGLKIVGDDLTESKRLFSAPPVSTEGDLYVSIAESMLKDRLSPTQNNFSAILRKDKEELTKKQVNGVIFITQKYCEPYDYLFYVYQKMLEEMGIPCLKLTRMDSTDHKNAETVIEAFVDSL